MHPPQMTGLQLLQAMSHGDLLRAPISETIPMMVDVIEAGTVHFGAQVDKRHLNPLGGVHGGFAATVLDSVTGCVVHPMLEAGIGYGMVDLNAKMVKVVPVDTPLAAVGRVLHLSYTIGVPEGTLKTQDDTLLAYATATCAIRCPQPHLPGASDT